MWESQGIQITAPRPQITDLDALPIMNRSLLNYEKYNRYIGQAGVKHCMTLQSTRGCPYFCAYCHKIWPKNHVVRSAENVFKEVELYYNLGIRRIAIMDDVFNFDRKNSSRFLQMVIDKGLDIKLFFETGLRGDILTKDYIDLMIEAGTVSITLALETASPRLQKLIRKNMNLKKLRENIDYFCAEYPHVMLGLQTMIGFPTETEEEANMTLDFIKSSKWLHFPYLHVLKIFPNTDMEKLALERGVPKDLIAKSRNQAYHELPETLPFSKRFAFKFQMDFLHDYFMRKERFLSVIPHQLKTLSQDELVQKYNSYLPVQVENYAGLLESIGIEESELGNPEVQDEEHMKVPDITEKLLNAFPTPEPDEEALRILLIDLTLYFSKGKDKVYDVVEIPLGLTMLMSYLQQEYKEKINGKVVKARIDFDDYGELKTVIEEQRPHVIGIRALTYYKDFFHETAANIREWGFKGPLLAGGPYATSEYPKILEDRNVSLAVLGEGELTLAELVQKIMENNGQLPPPDELQQINGLAYIPQKTETQKQKQAAYIFEDDLEEE